MINEHPIISTFIMIIAIIVSGIVIHYTIKICKIYQTHKTRKENEKSNAYVRALFDRKLGTISFNSGES